MTNATKFWILVAICFTIFISILPIIVISITYLIMCTFAIIDNDTTILPYEYNILIIINNYLNKL